MNRLDEFSLDHPIITGLRIIQSAIVLLSVLAFWRLGWVPLMVGVLVVIQFELLIIGMCLVYFLKRFCNDNGR